MPMPLVSRYSSVVPMMNAVLALRSLYFTESPLSVAATTHDGGELQTGWPVPRHPPGGWGGSFCDFSQLPSVFSLIQLLRWT